MFRNVGGMMRVHAHLALISVATLLVAAMPANAADLVLPQAASAASVAPYDWTGVYVGGNIGYTFGTSTASYVNPLLSAISLDSNPSGWSIGLGGGVNQQLQNGVVLGVEGDIDFSDVTDTVPDLLGGGGNTITSKTDWSGSLRGRVGYAAGNILPYLTAGLAVANATVSATDGPISESAVLSGWTAGAGLEFALDEHWSGKAEYLYTDLGTHTWFGTQPWASTAHSISSTIRVGLNYKF